ncbi:MAG TPA: L,D-transpeptidase family protein [Kribbella sp.]|nr:L,D-transpeptidase family protein [Kribbella sp.]
MTRRRRLGAGALLVATLAGLVGCADVPLADSPSTPSPTRTAVAPSSSKPTGTPSATPTRTPSQSPSKPTPTPTPKPTPKPTKKPASLALQVEQKLDSFGYPVGDVDGTITRRARQALCAWRETNGLPVSRGRLTTEDIRSVLLATKRPVATRPPGLYISKTCQVLFQVVDNTYRRIVWVSTGALGYETPSGTGTVWRKWAGAHESSLYDGAYMYDSIYFLKNRPGIALHGSRVNSLVKSYPASHSCVRVMRPQIHEIFAETPIGTRVSVYGEY